MNRELLSKAIGGIEDCYIYEAYRPVSLDASSTSGGIVHLKKKRLITFALAAALVLALGISAYSAGQALFGWSGNMEIRTVKTESGIEANVYVHTESLTEPVTFENGRIYFIVNDEHIDITDQVSETEPFIYQFTDPEGVVHYWILGKKFIVSD